MKLSLISVEVVIDLQICRTSISGPARAQFNNLVATNVSITVENMVSIGQLLFVICTAWDTQEYRFSLTHILIADSVLIRENTGKWKPIFSHSLSSDAFNQNFCINLKLFTVSMNYEITWFLGFRKPRTNIIMDVLFHWFLEHFWKIFGFFLQFCEKYVEVK